MISDIPERHFKTVSGSFIKQYPVGCQDHIPIFDLKFLPSLKLEVHKYLRVVFKDSLVLYRPEVLLLLGVLPRLIVSHSSAVAESQELT